MKKIMILLLTFAIAITGTTAPAARVTLKQLTMRDFITAALANNPAVKRIRAAYDQTRSLEGKAAAIRDIVLSAGTAWSWYNKVFSSGTLLSTDKNNWSVYATISKKFPKLLGLDASLAFAHDSVLSTATDGSDSSSHSPSLTLTVTIPLLKNFLGRVDNNDLKKMKLAIHMADRYEMEALEALLVTLQTAYINWALATEKAAIYRGSMNRAAVLLNQTLRKQRLGIADAADLALARQNYLSYRARLLGALTDSSTHYLSLLSLMRGKAPAIIAGAVRISHKPLLNWDKSDNTAKTVTLSDLRLIQISRLAVEDARLALSSASSSLKPDLNLIIKGGTGSSKTGLGSAFSSLDQNNLYGGLEFSFPLQNTEQKKARAAAIAAYKKASLEYRELVISMGYSIRSLQNALKTGKEALAVQKQVVYASLIRINAIYRKYRQGRVSLDRVTDARDAYANQQISYIEKSAALKKLALEYASQVDLLTRQYPLNPVKKK